MPTGARRPAITPPTSALSTMRRASGSSRCAPTGRARLWCCAGRAIRRSSRARASPTNSPAA
ncbi:MAG: hypothetical protein EKK29_14090 [Hyphomicrobiales bacterium]|nr:MAG: hypothetical protein EKK29_14090 [Hyphomicrobiales bacterium]